MKKLLFLLAIPVLLVSCSTDFDTISDYKEIMVVYGLLNQYDTVQLIKVNKAYLGEGNALIMAEQRDSINYADILTVTLDRYKNGNLMNSYGLARDTSIPKDPGVFNNPYQVFYKLSGQTLDTNSQYRLTIRNTNSGMEVYSQSAVLGNSSVEQPDRFGFIPTNGQTNKVNVRLRAAKGAKVYNMIFRFHYSETENGTGLVTRKYFDWIYPDQVVNPENVSSVNYLVYGNDFYYTVGQNIPVDTHVTRQCGNPDLGNNFPIELIVTAGSEDLYRYMQLSAPATTVVQERPQFSNIQNGVGLFTGRLKFSTFKDMTVTSKLALDTSIYTKDLNFEF